MVAELFTILFLLACAGVVALVWLTIYAVAKADKIDIGAAMAPHWDRLWYDIKNPLGTIEIAMDGRDKPKVRLGITDLSHAITNLPVEFCRAAPYTAGHVWLWQSLATLVVVLGGILGVLL